PPPPSPPAPWPSPPPTPPRCPPPRSAPPPPPRPASPPASTPPTPPPGTATTGPARTASSCSPPPPPASAASPTTAPAATTSPPSCTPASRTSTCRCDRGGPIARWAPGSLPSSWRRHRRSGCYAAATSLPRASTPQVPGCCGAGRRGVRSGGSAGGGCWSAGGAAGDLVGPQLAADTDRGLGLAAGALGRGPVAVAEGRGVQPCLERRL